MTVGPGTNRGTGTTVEGMTAMIGGTIGGTTGWMTGGAIGGMTGGTLPWIETVGTIVDTRTPAGIGESSPHLCSVFPILVVD